MIVILDCSYNYILGPRPFIPRPLLEFNDPPTKKKEPRSPLPKCSSPPGAALVLFWLALRARQFKEDMQSSKTGSPKATGGGGGAKEPAGKRCSDVEETDEESDDEEILETAQNGRWQKIDVQVSEYKEATAYKAQKGRWF